MCCVLCVCVLYSVGVSQQHVGLAHVLLAEELVSRRAAYYIFPPLQPGWEFDVFTAVVALLVIADHKAQRRMLEAAMGR